MSNNILKIDDRWLDFQQVKDLLKKDQQLFLTKDAEKKIEKCRKYLDKKLNSSDELFYGINTGFGFFQDVKISKTKLEQLLFQCFVLKPGCINIIFS